MIVAVRRLSADPGHVGALAWVQFGWGFGENGLAILGLAELLQDRFQIAGLLVGEREAERAGGAVEFERGGYDNALRDFLVTRRHSK